MIRCPDCSTENPDDARFCINCGRQLQATAQAEPVNAPNTPNQFEQVRTAGANLRNAPSLHFDEDLGDSGGERVLWEGRPNWPLSWLGVIMNRYKLTNERFIHEHGFIRKRTEQIDLYRIEDVYMRQGLIERMLNLGDVGFASADATAPHFELHDVRDPERVKDLIWRAARAERQRRRVLIREEM
ncbi:MAG TPA: PH domain-containing protein [Thermomicrobiales bacterium]